MKIVYKESPFPHVIINDFYEDEQLDKVQKELFFLKDNLESPEKTGSAILEGKILKSNSGIWLEDFYKENRNSSFLLTSLSDFIFNSVFMESLCRFNIIFEYIKRSSKDYTLLSYYENRDYYEPHYDHASFTCLFHWFKEPKQFTGGDLIFTDYTYTIPIQSNRIIIFPSFLVHSVDAVTTSINSPINSGRFAVSKFIHMGK